MMVVKAIFVLIIELLIYWILGALVADFLLRGKKKNVGMQIVVGFLGYQIFYQGFSFPFIITKQWFDTLVTAWVAALAIVLLIAIFLKRKVLLAQIKEVVRSVKQHPFCMGAGVLAVILFAYYAMMNGRLDDDSVYYIGLANTTLDLNIMFRSNVYTGELQPSLYLRRIFTTFEINAATLAKVFDVHPIFIMRVTRAFTNVILSAFSLQAIGAKLYQKCEQQECFKKSIGFMIIALYSNFLMEKTIFTNGTFLLHRTYEGKAFAAGTLILFAIYVCIELTFAERKREYLRVVVLLLWATTAISTTATVVVLAALLIWLLAFCGTKLFCKYVSRTEE